MRGGDDGIRERSRGRTRIPRARSAHRAGCGERRDRPGSHQREDVPRRRRVRRVAVRRPAHAHRRHDRGRGIAARHRQARALWLRRQGTVPRTHA